MSFWRSSTEQAEGKYRMALVVSEFNEPIVEQLLEETEKGLRNCGVPADHQEVFFVPGAFEMPFACKRLLDAGTFDAIITLGAIIKGETAHFDAVVQGVTQGITLLNVEGAIPVIFGVLTCLTEEQAEERIVLGKDYAETAVKMCNRFGQ